MMGAKRGIAQALVCLLMFPLLAAGIEFAGTQLMPAASAATRCDVEDPNADPGWGRTIDGFNLTGGFFGNNQDWERQDDDWDDPWSNDDNLRRLTTSFHTAFSIQNDTSSGLRMNLSTGFRYTFCITAHGNLSMPNPEAPEIDAYLLTESDYNLYSTWYKTRNDDWGIANEMRDMPVFAQGLVIWQPFRDVHAYEGMSKMAESLMDFDILYGVRTCFGDPAHAAQSLDAYAEIGIGEINFVTILPGLPQAAILDSLRCFAAELMPRYRD